jgi:N-acetylglutamate synthase-like GNAT family acetyltransferase
MAERWGDAFDLTANSDTHDLWASYMTNGRTFLVVENNGTLVGTGALVPESSGVSRILRMSVDRGHRRRGIARMLIAELLDVAQQLGSRKVVVCTDTPWAEAVALYRSSGFAVTDEDGTDTHFSIDVAA